MTNQPSLLDKLELHSRIEEITNSGSFEWNLQDDHMYCSENFFYITDTLDFKKEENKLSQLDFFSIIDDRNQNYILDVMHDSVSFNKNFQVSFHTTGSQPKKLKLFGYPEGDVKERKITGLVTDISRELPAREALLEGQDSERKRISLDLHDSVGQKLVATKYMISLMKIKGEIGNLDKLNDSIDEVIDEIRSITHNLSSQIVTELGLEQSLSQLLRDSAEALGAKQRMEFELPEDLEVTEDKAKMIYRVVQECLSNAMKYSKADRVSVSLKYINKQIILEINDNGVGFDAESVRNQGIGLNNIKQRITYLNGYLRISSQLGHGTSIKIRIPG